MHKIFSTRLDEELIRQIDRFVRERSITKKSLIERAVRAYLEQMGEKLEHEIVDRSFGAWTREETAQETWSRARQAFKRSFEGHKETSR